jgi:hypothetical protein
VNWDAIGAIGQMLGSVAVFVTLAYLSVQVRQAKQEVQRATALDRAATGRELSLARATSDSLCALRIKSRIAFGQEKSSIPFVARAIDGRLIEDEAYALYFEELAWWYPRVPAIQYIDHLPAAERDVFNELLRRNYGNLEPGRTWYERTKPILNADAVRYVDRVLAQRGSTPSQS